MNEYDFGLHGCRSIITGGEGAIGRCIANILASAGSNLVLVDLPDKLNDMETLANEIQEKYHVEVSCYGFDLREVNEIENFAAQLQNLNENVDILVNNAGINQLTDAFQFNEASWDNIVDINMKATFFMCQQIGRLMMKNRKGAIVNMASQHGVIGNEKRAPYCASKAGIINLSRSLAIDWAKYGIRVNCVSPGFVVHEKNEIQLNSSVLRRKYLPLIPLGRYCEPLEVANAVLYLVSNMSSYITGQNILVDGGYTAK